MNETSATSASGLSLLPDGIGTLTAIHFTIIAVVAILVIIGLLWGIRAKRSRVKASHDVIANAKEAGVAPEPVVATPDAEPTKAPVAVPSQGQGQTQSRTAAPVPVAPAPLPVTDEPVTGTAPQTPPPPSARSQNAEPVASAPAAIAPVATPAPAETVDPGASYADGPVNQLKGLGPKVAARLAELGVTTVSDMAGLSESEAQAIDAQLGAFTGRMGRDRWIEQARLLAAGDKAGFEAVFGKL